MINRERWAVIDEVGGYVCAAPEPGAPDGICGMPTESEPCPKHGGRAAEGGRPTSTEEDRTYPLPRPAEDARFNIGLLIAVEKALTGAGYPPLTGRDHSELQQALFNFLYEMPAVVIEDAAVSDEGWMGPDIEAER